VLEGLKEYLSVKRVAIDTRPTFHRDQLFPEVPAGEVEVASPAAVSTG
jgi:hypothetical protein